ncbi:MAG: FAD:protein FMN transferase [Clostridiales bacterium]|nr:FAD:protein FMN transferase [Clostridiales bacterium]
MKRSTFLMALLLLMLSLTGCGEQQRRESHFAMDTYMELTIFQGGEDGAEQACFDLMDAYDDALSITNRLGDVGRINEKGTAQVSADTVSLIHTALEMARITKGAFDPTLLPLKELWNIAERTEEDPLPKAAEIASVKAFTGYEGVSVAGETVTLQEGMGLDLGAIAKGYVADRCAELLLKKGVKEAIINMGGNVRLVGQREFNVGVIDPRGQNGTLLLTMALSDCSIVTSGDYERFVEVNGVRYHHILDPETGSPAQSGLCSVTVIGKDGAMCDALSTAFFVLGVEDSMKIIKEHRLPVETIFASEDGRVAATAGIGEKINLKAQGYTLEVLK